MALIIRLLLPVLLIALPASASRLPLTFSGTTGARTSFQPCGIQQALGAAKSDGLRIARVRWVQTAAFDPDDSGTVLAGGKNTLVRVDLLADHAGVKAPVVKVFLRDANSSTCSSLTLRGPGVVPIRLDNSALSTGYTAVVGAAHVQPGLRMVTIAVDSVVA